MTPEQFKAERKRLGKTQVEMAVYLHKVTRTIQRYENGSLTIGKGTIEFMTYKANGRPPC